MSLNIVAICRVLKTLNTFVRGRDQGRTDDEKLERVFAR